VAGSIDGTFSRFNEVVYVVGVMPKQTRRPVTRGGRKAVQPGLDGFRFKADEAVNTAAGNLALGNPEIECGFFDIEPSRELFDSEHVQIHRGSLSTPPVPLAWAARVTAGRPVKPSGLLEQIAVSVFPPSNAPDNFVQ
jgi:hypothetical protein